MRCQILSLLCMHTARPLLRFVLCILYCSKINSFVCVVRNRNLNRALVPSLRMLSSSIKFTSYNVLSSHLSEATHFLACDPKFLDPNYRLQLVKAKLEAEVNDGAVICLQEVSHKWAGVLHTFFAQRGYHMVTGLYGAKFNGYMGVAVAVPTSKYDIVDVDITRVADTKRMQRKPKPGFVQNIFQKVGKFLLNIAVSLGMAKQSFDFWDNVLYRTNQMICLRLTGKEDKRPFVVGTYHMPCMFKKPAGRYLYCCDYARMVAR
jgi:2',5'-phosphodiesterase